MLPQKLDGLITLWNFFTNVKQERDQNKGDASKGDNTKKRSFIPAALSKEDEIFDADILMELDSNELDAITEFLKKFPPKGEDGISKRLRDRAREHFRDIVVNLPIEKMEQVINVKNTEGKTETTTTRKQMFTKENRSVKFLKFVASEIRRTQSCEKVYESLRMHNIVPRDASDIIATIKKVSGDNAVDKTKKVSLLLVKITSILSLVTIGCVYFALNKQWVACAMMPVVIVGLFFVVKKFWKILLSKITR